MNIKTTVTTSTIIAIIAIVVISIKAGYTFRPKSSEKEFMLVEKSKEYIVFNELSEDLDTKYLIVDTLVIANRKLIMNPGDVLLANKITMESGGEIYGNDYTIIATQINGGSISATGANNRNGGNIFIVSAVIEGTLIQSNGLSGRDGSAGKNGIDGHPGKNGRDGLCKGFGSWRTARRGENGENGTDGENGEDGENGGDAGQLTILVSNELAEGPIAKGGDAGRGGGGGEPGLGGAGGKGGRGCTGLGGAQPDRPSGLAGHTGSKGTKGKPGKDGMSVTPIVKQVDFHTVADIVKEFSSNEDELIIKLKSLSPKSPLKT